MKWIGVLGVSHVWCFVGSRDVSFLVVDPHFHVGCLELGSVIVVKDGVF